MIFGSFLPPLTDATYLSAVELLTVWHGVDPVLVETCRDAVHLCGAGRLLQLPPLLRQSALHHGGL